MQSIVVRWPGGEHAFRLGLAEMEVIQDRTDCGPEYLLLKINAGQWKTTDLFEVIRNGLIGGGMAHVEALNAVRNAFERDPIVSFKVPAQEILSGFLYGPPDDPVGEGDPVSPTPESEKTDAGNSAPTTASGQ